MTEVAEVANRAGKRTAEHDENGGTCERTGANEHFTQLHVFWRTGSHRSQTIYRQRHQSGGMSSLWKNAFSLSPSKGVLRFKAHTPRKQQTPLTEKRWSATG